jgi:hypothetical protein
MAIISFRDDVASSLSKQEARVANFMITGLPGITLLLEAT